MGPFWGRVAWVGGVGWGGGFGGGLGGVWGVVGDGWGG